MTPEERYQEHTARPQHMGRMDEPDGIGTVGSIVAGRALRFFIKVTDGVITKASFQVFACAEQVAPASLLCSTIIGKKADECRDFGRADIAAAADGLPLWWLPPVVWGPLGMRLALANALGWKEEIALDDEPSALPLLCRCHGIGEQTVLDSIEQGITDVDGLMAATGAGTGCGSCRTDLQRLLDAGLPEPEESLPTGPGGRVALMKQVAECFADFTKNHGIQVEPWDFKGSTVIARVGHGAPEDLGERLGAVVKNMVDPSLHVEIREG